MISAGQRQAALAAARVWLPPKVAPATVDFTVNPPGPGRFDPRADVECQFTPKAVGGTTPKFYCTMATGEVLKVKYGEPNGEIPAEIAATRLLGALGFPVDRMYRVRSVRCRGCPLLPQQALKCLAEGGPASLCLQGASPDRAVTFEHAAIERPFDGRKLEASDDQGWSWFELDTIDPSRGGSTRAEVDALRLMAVLLAHWDNKGPNQRLVCPEGQDRPDGSCAAPLAIMQDLGATFGPTKADLLSWKAVPIWIDARACRVGMSMLPYAGATFPEHVISEEGRLFALKLLGALSAAQLNALFEGSGLTAFNHVLAAAREPQSWTDAFLAKVDQMARGGPCPRGTT